MNSNLLRQITLGTLFCFLFTEVLTAQAPTVNCPAVPVEVNDFSTNDSNFWNAAWSWEPFIFSHDLGETQATALDITGTDHCSASGNLSFRYILSLDLDRNNVYETFIDSDSLPGKNSIYVGNAVNNLFSGTVRGFDTRPVNANQKWGFDIVVTADGANRKAQVIWKNTLGQTTPAEIPYGNHHIKWFVTDSCGATTVCEYNFTIRDGKKPVVVCINGISVNLINIQGGKVQLWASDFLQYTQDNFTPGDQLILGIRRSGTGTGFPYNPDGTPQTGVQFSCADLGTQPLELWSIDKHGNADFCETFILIQDNLGLCTPGGPPPTGTITNELLEGIAGVSIELSGWMSGLPTFSLNANTDSVGIYHLNNNSLPVAAGTTINPVLDLDPLNGVNAWDLVLISRHILGLEMLNSPYKIISADVNRSKTITTFDIVELRKLVLGTYTEFPNNNSWRFVDKTQVFNSNINPFADTLRETLPYFNPGTKDFIGCKIGDVDLTATPHFRGVDVVDRNTETAFIQLNNQQLIAGQTFTVHFTTPRDVEGLQMTIATNGLQVDNIIPGDGIDKDNFARFSGDRFTAVFEQENATFDVQFTAQTSGELKDMLEVTGDITPAICFGKNGDPKSLAFRFVDELLPGDVPILYAPSPNPWKESTQIGFYLPNDSDMQLSVVDPNDAVVKTISGTFSAGEHQMRFSKNDFPRAGMYYVRMRAGDFVEVKKMVLVR